MKFNKRLPIIPLLLLLQLTTMRAQNLNRSEIGVMVTGGIKNWTRIQNDDIYDNGLSIGAGLLVEQQIVREKIGVQMGLLYRNRGDCEDWALTDKNGDPLGTDRVNIIKGDLSVPITLKINIKDYYIGIGGEAGMNIIYKGRGAINGEEQRGRLKDAALAWHSKAGMRKEVSNNMSLVIELEYVHEWTGSYTNFHFGIGFNYKLAS